MKIMALCDFYTDSVRPLKLIVQAGRDGFDWSQVLYIPISGPFEPADPCELSELDVQGASVLLSDLVRRQDNPVELGINMPAIAERHGPDPELLWIEMDDAEEVMKYIC
ncbi:hypothetical protein [Paenibacillus macerans]|uniref:hypothetical protein n=1 Tax=Paenibacillus macerans TaxID=44252 RepID=UPI00203CDF6E|nr:hypothetical protein [Paenibacillus macerans]MCM3699253.1 hypothetical protein [Paenibacillus macerans]